MIKNIIVNTIKERKFHDIPDWMIRALSPDMFMELVGTMESILDNLATDTIIPYKYFPKDTTMEDMLSFLDRVRDMRVMTAPKFVSLFMKNPQLYTDSTAIYITSYLISSDRDWRCISHILFKYRDIWLPVPDNTLFIPWYVKTACAIHKHRFGYIPSVPVEFLLKFIDFWVHHGRGDEVAHFLFAVLKQDMDDYQPIIEESFWISTGNDFRDELIDTIRSRASKYYWGDKIFALEDIWAFHISYLPKKLDMQYFIAYLWKMTNNCDCELSERALQYIHEVINSRDADLQNIVFKSINMLFVEPEPNANNIRFLMPFYDIPEYRNDIDSLIQHLLESNFFMNPDDKNFNRVLRDFTYFLPKEMNNDTIQKKFLMQGGGNPNTLLSGKYDGDTYIRTADGICSAILYSNPEYLEELLTDNTICDVLINELMGKIPFSPIIEKLVPVVERGVRYNGNANLHAVRMMINKYYPLVETASEVYTPLLRISPMGIVESASIISKRSNAAFHISVYEQSVKGLISSIRANCTNKNYIPLYYGLNETHGGIEDILNLNEIIRVLKTNNAYLADIKNEDVVELLLSHSFLWEN